MYEGSVKVDGMEKEGKFTLPQVETGILLMLAQLGREAENLMEAKRLATRPWVETVKVKTTVANLPSTAAPEEEKWVNPPKASVDQAIPGTFPGPMPKDPGHVWDPAAPEEEK
jgi:hypothetical protein